MSKKGRQARICLVFFCCLQHKRSRYLTNDKQQTLSLRSWTWYLVLTLSFIVLCQLFITSHKHITTDCSAPVLKSAVKSGTTFSQVQQVSVKEEAALYIYTRVNTSTVQVRTIGLTVSVYPLYDAVNAS